MKFLLILLLCAGAVYSGNHITFRLNMQKAQKEGLFAPQQGDRLILRDSFHHWQDAHTELSDTEQDSIFILDTFFPDTLLCTLEFKFAILKIDSTLIWELEPNPENPPYGNRVLLLTGNPYTVECGTFSSDRYSLLLAGKTVLFSVPEMQEDFLQLRSALESTHPHLYAFTSRKAFNHLFDRQFQKIVRPLQAHEFFRLLTPLTAAVGCGHTNLWMPVVYWDTAPPRLFPLQIRVLNGAMVVAGAYDDSLQLPVGSIIKSINGTPARAILDSMFANCGSDGHNSFGRRASVERRFPMIYARRYGFPDSFRVCAQIPGQPADVNSKLKPANIQGVRKEVFENFGKQSLSMQCDPSSKTAVLRIPGFGYYDRQEYFRNFVDSCFSDIQSRGIEKLILDLRKNNGGDPFCAAHLFSYLEKRPLPYFAQPYGKYAQLAEPLPRAPKAFEGQLYILIDTYCLSTNAHLCALLKYHNMGTFIGEPGGGTYTCNAATKVTTLSHSRFMLYTASGTFQAAVKGMDKAIPIMPDVLVTETVDDLIQGRDPVMEYARGLTAR